MTRGTVKGWYLVHKWTSLVCTAGAPNNIGEDVEHA